MMNKHGTKWRPHAHTHKSHETKKTRHQSQSDANCSPQSAQTHIQFWKCPLPAPHSDAHTIIAHTHVGRASDSTHLWFCTCAEKKSSRLFFRDSWNRLPNLCSALQENAWVKDGIWSVAQPAWMVINGGLQNSNTFQM